MTFIFEPAVKAALHGRLALIGPAGSGKTWTGLLTASALTQGGRIAVIDTQRRQSLHYADIFKFDVTHMTGNFHPDMLTAALADCSTHDAVIIDSWSSFWSGDGGMLEQVDRASDGKPGSSFNNGWKTMRPAERRMFDAMMSFPGHLIATIRTKTEWVVSNEGGKIKPHKVGTKPEQREDLEYEFDLVATMDKEHTLTVVKSHCPPLTGQVIERPAEDFGNTFLQWLDNGERPKTVWDWRSEVLDKEHTPDTLREVRDKLVAAGVGGAAVLDDYGDATTLVALANRLGAELMKQARGATKS